MSRDQPAQTPWGRTWRAFPRPGPGAAPETYPPTGGDQERCTAAWRADL